DFARHESVSAESRLVWMLDWMDRHPQGTGWDPHPLGLRIVSWGKMFRTAGALPEAAGRDARLQESLARQIETLSKNLEVRLQANHLLSNLIGVVFGGLLFDGPEARRWLGYWPQLKGELALQVPGDGLHEERSPMYHALLFENVLDLLNLAEASDSMVPDGMVLELQTVARRMRGALAMMCHPDGEIALFADSALGIAQRPSDLEDYADRLGVSEPPTQSVLPEGGYVRLVAGPFTVIASVAGPAPAHQPGHAHCDALAFELSYRSQRVITDTGVFEYVPGEKRRVSRATASHSTLEVDCTEQAEIWAAHRVGGRPRVLLERVEPEKTIVASCRGWSTLDTLHRRRFCVEEHALEIRDALQGNRRPVRLYLHLAPDLEARLSHDRDGGTEAHVRLLDGAWLRIALPVAANWRIGQSPYYPTFGSEKTRACLIGEADRFDQGSFRFEIVN
ncbi:heparinase II/III family protein, partial [Myxococcota bacterium]|nr:heparinase II/III family protein [Myxococcota bacterium]